MSGDPWCDGIGVCLVLALGALLALGTGLVDATSFGLALLLGAVIGVAAGLIALRLWGDGGTEAAGRGWPSHPLRPRPQGMLSGQRGGDRIRAGLPSHEQMLRERYALGELSREQYLAMLEDILKDRYVRGELDLDEYEARLDQLLRQPGPAARASGRS